MQLLNFHGVEERLGCSHWLQLGLCNVFLSWLTAPFAPRSSKAVTGYRTPKRGAQKRFVLILNNLSFYFNFAHGPHGIHGRKITKNNVNVYLIEP